MAQEILVVDDERSMRDFLSIFLKKKGYEVTCVGSGEEALQQMENQLPDLVISDIRMPGMDGMSLLREAKKRKFPCEFIVITAFSNTADAIVAMNEGAYDYINKPFKLDEIEITIKRALEKRSIEDENLKLKQELSKRHPHSNIIGKSDAITRIFDLINQVADTKTTILIAGESGTGKELVARAVHETSSRHNEPFVTINCGAIPAELMESELFGHVKGSFTGAIRDKEGLFTAASNGTLFLDEVSELPLPLQVKLLRALQERKVQPVGGTVEIPIDTRVIAATNRDLLEAVNNNRFREDLYYRLNVIQIKLPPLRERKDDIPLLAQHFIERFCKESGRKQLRISEAAMMILQSHRFPGNVRELSNLIERAVALETMEQIRPQSLPSALLEQHINKPQEIGTHSHDAKIDIGKGVNLDEILDSRERELIGKALDYTSGVKKDAARLLGISFRSLRYRLKKLGMEDDSTGEMEE